MSKELLEKIYDKVENLSQDVKTLAVITARQEINLQNHMKRSDTLEAEMKLLEQRMEPIEDHVKSVNFWMKLAGSSITVASAIASIVELFKFLK